MSGYLKIGRIVSSHGVRGEVKVKSFSGDDTHFKSADSLILRRSVGGTVRERKVKLLSLRGALPNLIAAFEGISSPEDARAYRGAELLIERNAAQALKDGEYYFADLEGCALEFNGAEVGRVKSVWENSNCDMLEVVLTDGRIAQVPLQDKFVAEVDTQNARIELRVDWILE